MYNQLFADKITTNGAAPVAAPAAIPAATSTEATTTSTEATTTSTEATITFTEAKKNGDRQNCCSEVYKLLLISTVKVFHGLHKSYYRNI